MSDLEDELMNLRRQVDYHLEAIRREQINLEYVLQKLNDLAQKAYQKDQEISGLQDQLRSAQSASADF